MQLFLHVIFSIEPLDFETEIGVWVKEKLPGVIYFNIDQNSDYLVMSTAIEAIEKAERIFTYIEGSTSDLQSVFKLIKKLQSVVESKSVQIVDNTDNPLLAKLSKTFGPNWHNNIDQITLNQKTTFFFKD